MSEHGSVECTSAVHSAMPFDLLAADLESRLSRLQQLNLVSLATEEGSALEGVRVWNHAIRFAYCT